MHLQGLLSPSEWLVEENGYDAGQLGVLETLFTVGNGYLGTRGSLEEGIAGEWPATYLAGIFDDHDSTVVELVSAPDWLPVSIWVDGERLNMQSLAVLEHRRRLDLRQGLLYRATTFEDRNGRQTLVESLRFASLASPHLCCMRVSLTPLNFGGSIRVESTIDGRRRNLDRLPVYAEPPELEPADRWEKWAKSRHLEHVTAADHGDAVYLESRTLGRDHRLGYAAALSSEASSVRREPRLDYERAGEVLSFEAAQGETSTVDKLVAIHTSRDTPRSALGDACLETLRAAAASGFDSLLAAHSAAWADRWSRSDCSISGDAEATHALRFNIYHLLITAGAEDPRVSVGAKTLSGEGYKGHVFWDTEIFLLPFYIYTQPEIARSLLLYRYYTMPAALENARRNGFAGAQFAWESADTGEETTPRWTADRKHRIWTGEEEIHITADVAYGVVTYVTATGDWDFMREHGAEILFNTARFWDSRLENDAARERYEIRRVIGPDEFHEHVDNNAFTNALARWNLEQAAEVFERLAGADRDRLAAELTLDDREIECWRQKARRIYVPSDPESGVIEQFAGYFELEELGITSWDRNGMPLYPEGYDHFNVGATTLVKQPDVVMLMYLLPDEFDDKAKKTNYDFYEERTMHKSSLSPCIHSIMGIEVGDTARAEQYFRRSALVDLIDNQGNTQDGIHAASAGGTWMSAVFGFGGFRVRQGRMTFKPWLPAAWRELSFTLCWQGDELAVALRHGEVELELRGRPGAECVVSIFDQSRTLCAGKPVSIPVPS